MSVDRRGCARAIGPGVTLALVALGLASEYGGLDRTVADALYAPADGGWVHGKGWLWNEALHEGGRMFVKVLALAMFAVFLASLYATRRLAAAGAAASLLFLSILIGAGGVNLAKTVTSMDCPWSLERYGGDRPYVHLFSQRPAGLPRAHCFPGGHSAGGFALVALYFVARGRRWRRAGLYAVPGIALGSVFAITQWLRGAHFPSHDLWSAAACWLVAWVLYESLMRRHLAERTAQSAG